MRDPDIERKLEARDRVLESLQTLIRLGELEQRHEKLTDNQRSDYWRARDVYNANAPILSPHLRRMEAGVDWTDEDLDRLVESVKEVGSMVDASAAVRSAAPGLYASLPDTETRRVDEIRDLLASGERHAEFPFETRTIANFNSSDDLWTADFSTRVATYERTLSPWLGLATIVNSTEGRDLVVPQLTGDPTNFTPGEGTAITPADPTLANVTIVTVAYKTLTILSAEALEDSAVNLTDIVARSAGRSIGLAAGSAFTTAILSGITNAGTATWSGTPTSTFFGYSDLVGLKYSAPAPYRSNGTFVLANGALSKVAKWQATTGEPLWLPSVGANQPDTLLGDRVFEDPFLATPASATKSVIYGDAAAGLVIKQMPLRVDVSRDWQFNLDTVAVKVVHRLGLGIVDPLALRYLVSANT